MEMLIWQNRMGDDSHENVNFQKGEEDVKASTMVFCWPLCFTERFDVDIAEFVKIIGLWSYDADGILEAMS